MSTVKDFSDAFKNNHNDIYKQFVNIKTDGTIELKKIPIIQYAFKLGININQPFDNIMVLIEQSDVNNIPISSIPKQHFDENQVDHLPVYPIYKKLKVFEKILSERNSKKANLYVMNELQETFVSNLDQAVTTYVGFNDLQQWVDILTTGIQGPIPELNWKTIENEVNNIIVKIETYFASV